MSKKNETKDFGVFTYEGKEYRLICDANKVVKSGKAQKILSDPRLDWSADERSAAVFWVLVERIFTEDDADEILDEYDFDEVVAALTDQLFGVEPGN